MTPIGKVIAKRREALAMSRKALAEQAGFDPSNLYRLEDGKQNTTIERLAAIAAALGTTMHSLVAESELGNVSDGLMPWNISMIPLIDTRDALPEARQAAMKAAPRLPLEMVAPDGAWAIVAENDAMAPVIQPGARVVLAPAVKARSGDVVLVHHHQMGTLLRRAVRDGDLLRLRADHWNLDPVTLGPEDTILGVAIAACSFTRLR